VGDSEIKENDMRKGMLVQSKTTGAIGKIVDIDRAKREIVPLGVLVDWKTENKIGGGYPASYQFVEDLKIIKKQKLRKVV
jgi:hypothetical protein